MDSKELFKAAEAVMEHAYVPYSHFRVGAAVRTKSGKIYSGCNIENASYGAANCAERTAIFKAISEGEREFCEIAIVSSSEGATYPCGICRQVLAEHMPQGIISVKNQNNEVYHYTVEELFPHMFTKEDLG